MSKIPRPPESWPPEARQLWWDYSRRVRNLSAFRQHLNSLALLLRRHAEKGLGFRDFTLSLLQELVTEGGPRTAPHRASLMRRWLRFLYQRKQLLLPLHRDLKVARAPLNRRRLLSVEQMSLLLELPPLDDPQGLRDRAYLELAYGSGLRRGELAALNLKDIDLAEGVVSIRRSKNGRARQLPLTGWAIHFLLLYLRQGRPQLASPLSSEALWLNRFGRRLSRASVGCRLKTNYQVAAKLGFSVTLHQLRHACASHLLAGGAGIRDIQEMLGHQALTSTQIYTHVNALRLLAVHQRCHPRNLADFGK